MYIIYKIHFRETNLEQDKRNLFQIKHRILHRDF